jgi:hypothetical protein
LSNTQKPTHMRAEKIDTQTCEIDMLCQKQILVTILDSGAILHLTHFLHFSCFNECKRIKYNIKTKSSSINHAVGVKF